MPGVKRLKLNIALIKRQLRFWLMMLTIPLLVYSCFKGNKQNVDAEAPDKIKQLVPKYTSCGACPPVINQYQWKGQIIYGKTCAGPACDCIIVFYDKNGDGFKMDTASLKNFNTEGILVKHIWICKD